MLLLLAHFFHDSISCSCNVFRSLPVATAVVLPIFKYHPDIEILYKDLWYLTIENFAVLICNTYVCLLHILFLIAPFVHDHKPTDYEKRSNFWSTEIGQLCYNIRPSYIYYHRTYLQKRMKRVRNIWLRIKQSNWSDWFWSVLSNWSSRCLLNLIKYLIKWYEPWDLL